MPDLLLAGALTLGGGILSLIGSYWTNEISEDQFNRELAFRQSKTDRELALQAERLGLTRQQLNQQYQQFLTSLKEQKRQFDESIGFQKEQFKFKKFESIIKPAIEQNRRSKNLLRAFSGISKGLQGAQAAGGVTAPTAPAAPSPTGPNPLTAAPQGPAPAANPLTA